MVGIILAIIIVYAVLWVKFVMKKGLFETTPLEEVLEHDDLSEPQAVPPSRERTRE